MNSAEREALVAAVAARIVQDAMRMFLSNDLDAEMDCADVFGECGLCETEIASVTAQGLKRANATLADLDARGLDVRGARTPHAIQ